MANNSRTNIAGSGVLTMGTINMTGFSVDADGDTSAKSLTSTSTISGSGALFATGGRNMGVCWDCGRILGRFLSPALHRRGAEYDFTVCLFVGAGHCGG